MLHHKQGNHKFLLDRTLTKQNHFCKSVTSESWQMQCSSLKSYLYTIFPGLGPEKPLVISEMISRAFVPYSLLENKVELYSKVEQGKCPSLIPNLDL